MRSGPTQCFVAGNNGRVVVVVVDGAGRRKAARALHERAAVWNRPGPASVEMKSDRMRMPESVPVRMRSDRDIVIAGVGSKRLAAARRLAGRRRTVLTTP